MNERDLLALKAAVPAIVQWMRQTIDTYAPAARSLGSYQFSQLGRFFPADVQAAVRVVEVDGAVPRPPLATLGFSALSDFERADFDGITYGNLYFLKRSAAQQEALHFHELIHVLQWEVLGVESFLLRYADELLRFQYAEAPLEKMAYGLQAHFERSGDSFDARAMVRQLLGLQA